jgi:hypothetical protein
MSSYALTLGAKRDLYEIWSYIAEDSEESADRVELAIMRVRYWLDILLTAGFAGVSPCAGYVFGPSRAIRITSWFIGPSQFPWRS